MGELLGFPYVINPWVAPGMIAIWKGKTIAFHDRYDLIRYVYWSRLGPVLDRLAGEAAVRWERAKYEQSRRTDSVR